MVYMKRTSLFFFLVLLLVGITSCNEPSVEEEIDAICECVKSATNNEEMKKCKTKMDEISDKYAFDPEAAETIKKRLKECVSN